jgi:hypothetical protein
MIVFDKTWFEKHQKNLLRFANTPMGRKVLCIDGDKSSVGDNRIVKIEPHAITWVKSYKDKQLTTEIRGHEKYGKRLYYAFYPFWKAAHNFDMIFANKFKPSWNLGFDTFGPVYPVPGSTVDGYVVRSASGTWAQVRDGAGTSNEYTSGNAYASVTTGGSTGVWMELYRSIFGFDISTLPEGIITAATFSLRVSSKSNALGSAGLCVTDANPASNSVLENGDYSRVGSIELATRKVYADVSTTVLTDFPLNAEGLSYLTSASIRFFGCRLSYDLDNAATWVSSKTSSYVFLTSEYLGTDNDPKLTITYTVSSGGGGLLLLGVG